MSSGLFYIIIIISVTILMIIIIGLPILLGYTKGESPEKKAGRMGERFATSVISEILDKDDILLTNVRVSSGGNNTELDNVIINKNGVFIIEVKNYSGDIAGAEEDDEWIKIEAIPSGGIYQKTVKNPLKQVKRQVDIVTGYLGDRGISVRVKGFVFFVNRNSPIGSSYVLVTQKDVNDVIHEACNSILTAEIQESINRALE